MSAALELRGVDAGYGVFRSLFDVSLEVAAGEAHERVQRFLEVEPGHAPPSDRERTHTGSSG